MLGQQAMHRERTVAEGPRQTKSELASSCYFGIPFARRLLVNNCLPLWKRENRASPATLMTSEGGGIYHFQLFIEARRTSRQ